MLSFMSPFHNWKQKSIIFFNACISEQSAMKDTEVHNPRRKLCMLR